jgi:two-component system nitrate/nitrite response regulator NarL
MSPRKRSLFALLTQPIVGEGLARILSADGGLEWGGQTADPTLVTEQVALLQPSLLLLDRAYGSRTLGAVLRLVREAGGDPLPVLWTRDASVDWRLMRDTGVRASLESTRSIEALAGRLREIASAGPDGQVPGGGAGAEARLSDREREVLKLAGSGMSNREIAERMSITAGTVKVHLKHVFEKTGLRGRDALAPGGGAA